MTPRELLDTYANRDGGQSGGDTIGELAPEAFAALRAVLDLHEETTFSTWSACKHCTDDGPGLVTWPCPTVDAITEALEGTDG